MTEEIEGQWVVFRMSNAAIAAKKAAVEMCFKREVCFQLTLMQNELKKRK
jgi:hypothetical protein